MMLSEVKVGCESDDRRRHKNGTLVIMSEAVQRKSGKADKRATRGLLSMIGMMYS